MNCLRTGYLKLPKVEFYQLKVHYETVTVEVAELERDIANAVPTAAKGIIKQTDFTLEHIIHEVDDTEWGTKPGISVPNMTVRQRRPISEKRFANGEPTKPKPNASQKKPSC